MNSGEDRPSLRAIPPVDDILDAAEVSALREAHPGFPWTQLVREVTAEARAGKLGPVTGGRERALSAIVARVVSRFEDLREGGMRRVINATGVVLNTNLGRAVLGREAADAVRDAMNHYVNLEIDLETGKRSRRAETLEELLRLLSRAEDAMVVNNNAAAVWLVVDSYSPPGRVIVSRGELVEIGGSFRLPDILAKAAGAVVEVGTTNRTYASDYERAAEPGDVLLKVHRSNYDIRGFTHEAQIADLVRVGAARKCHVVYDLGSGGFFDFASRGMAGEPRVQEVLETGVDCATMSGDKLLGGAQAGIVLGKRSFISKLKQNPLRRAVRVDKTAIAALQAVARVYLFHRRPEETVPILRQAMGAVEDLEKRARNIVAGIEPAAAKRFEVRVEADPGAIGGGSFAVEDLPSVAVAIRCASEQDAVSLARRLRLRRLPVLARIKADEVRLNLRSILEHEDGDLVEALNAVLGTL